MTEAFTGQTERLEVRRDCMVSLFDFQHTKNIYFMQLTRSEINQLCTDLEQSKGVHGVNQNGDIVGVPARSSYVYFTIEILADGYFEHQRQQISAMLDYFRDI